MRGLVCLCFTQVKQMDFTGFYFENTWVKHPFIFPTEHWNNYNECKLEFFFFCYEFQKRNFIYLYLCGFWYEEAVLRRGKSFPYRLITE